MIFIILSLFSFPSAMAVQDWHASLNALVYTNVGAVSISGNADIGELERVESQNPESVFIPSVTVSIDDLSASIPGVMPVLRKSGFFHSARYPEISVNDVTMDRQHRVNGRVTMKGCSRVVTGSWQALPSKRLQIRFLISLHDFNISHRVMFFKIDDLAQVQVEMDNPFEKISSPSK